MPQPEQPSTAENRAVEDIARQFSGFSELGKIDPINHGLVNQTYRIENRQGGKAILQRINPRVFPDPEAILGNHSIVSQHLDESPDYAYTLWRLPGIVPLHSGALFFRDSNAVWRALEYIEPSHVVTAPKSLQQVRSAGAALGQFHRLLQPLSSGRLVDTLPGFHDMGRYWQALDQMRSSRQASAVSKEVWQFLATHEKALLKVDEARLSGRLPRQVTHGDPKLANFLFHPESDEVVGVIDLDTLKPGVVLYDLADCIRSCCNLQPKELPGEFDLEAASILLTAYVAEYGAFLSEQEYGLLIDVIKALPLELGIRYLTDHLSGDVYFNTHFSGQNLQRALHYFGLVTSIGRQQEKLARVVEKSFQ